MKIEITKVDDGYLVTKTGKGIEEHSGRIFDLCDIRLFSYVFSSLNFKDDFYKKHLSDFGLSLPYDDGLQFGPESERTMMCDFQCDDLSFTVLVDVYKEKLNNFVRKWFEIVKKIKKEREKKK